MALDLQTFLKAEILLLIQYKQIRSKPAQHHGQTWKVKKDWFIFSCFLLSKPEGSCIGRVRAAKGSKVFLIFPLFTETLGCGRSEISCEEWTSALLGWDGKEKWFPWFSESRGAPLIWHSLKGCRRGHLPGERVRSLRSAIFWLI